MSLSDPSTAGLPTTSSRQAMRGMTVRCLVALTLMGAMLLTGFFITRRAAVKFENAAALIDLVGRQRMLLSLAGLLTERLLEAETAAERLAVREQLEDVRASLSAGHRAARHRDATADGRSLPEEVLRVFASDPYRLDARMDEFLQRLASVASIPDDQLTALHDDVISARAISSSGELLNAQDAVVQAFKSDIERSHARLMLTNSIVLGCGLFTLVGTGLGAIWPMIRQVQLETSRLEQVNALLAAQKHALSLTLGELKSERDDRRNRMRAMANIMEDLEEEQAALKREIQTRQSMQEKLQASEQRFFAIIESAPTAMVMIDANGEIGLVNGETEKLFGYGRDELLKRKIELLVPNRFTRRHPEHRDAFFAKPEVRRMGAGRDLFGLRKDGSEFPVEIGLNPIETDEGLFVLSAIVDITERKRAEAEINRINEELRQKNDEMQQFVYTVSHDLKSPLVTCKGFVGIMKEDAEAGRWDEMLDSVGRVERATERMEDLIEDLLQLSRIGVIRNEPERIEVAAIVETIVDELSDRIQAAGAALTIQDDLPPVVADRVRIEEVFENLLANAIRYGCRGESPHITIGGGWFGGEVRYFVQDNGPGIAPEFHDKIFGLFQRLEADKEGTGVGLAAVVRIMEVHRGRVWVESDRDAGATFWLAFPQNT